MTSGAKIVQNLPCVAIIPLNVGEWTRLFFDSDSLRNQVERCSTKFAVAQALASFIARQTCKLASLPYSNCQIYIDNTRFVGSENECHAFNKAFVSVCNSFGVTINEDETSVEVQQGGQRWKPSTEQRIQD